MYRTLLPFLILLQFQSWAQTEKGTLNINLNPAGIVETFPVKKEATSGSNYYSDSWSIGNIFLKNGQVLESKPLMYDVRNQILELKFNNSIYVITTIKVARFEWFDKLRQDTVSFVSSKNYDFSDFKGKISSFSRVLIGGNVGLISMTKSKLIKANYNVVLDVGEKGDKIVQETAFFLIKNEKAHLIPSSKKKVADLFEGVEGEMKKYIKSQKLAVNNQSGLIDIVTYYKLLQK